MITFRQYLLSEFAAPTSFHDALKLALRTSGLKKIYLECKVPLKSTVDLSKIISIIGRKPVGGIKKRSIMFYDTPDKDMLKSNKIVRTRSEGSGIEVTQKTRGDFPTVISDKTPITKFKVEAIAKGDKGYKLVYSHNHEVEHLPNKEDLAPITKKQIVEHLQELEPLSFSHDIDVKENVCMWYSDDKPLIGEYEFSCHIHKDDLKHLEKIEEYYAKVLKDLSSYIETGLTKTQAVYNLTSKHS